MWSTNTYNILKCGGCDEIYVQKSYVFSEDEEYEEDPRTGEVSVVLNPKISYWPPPARRKRPNWTAEIKDHALRELLDEVYGALDSDYRVLAAIGARTTIDRALVLMGAEETSSFAKKLQELKEAGAISQKEMDMLSVLTDAGSAAAHRGWKPTPDQLSTILDGAEALLHRAFILGHAVAAMKRSVPRKSKRKKARKPTPEKK